MIEAKNINFSSWASMVLQSTSIYLLKNTCNSKGLEKRAWKSCNLYTNRQKRKKLQRMHWISFLQVSIKNLASFLFQNNHNTFSAFNQNMIKCILQLCKLVVNYVGGIPNFWCSFKLGKHGIKGLNCCSCLSSPPKSQLNCFRCLVKRSM